MCERSLEFQCRVYLSKLRENSPCNPAAFGAFFLCFGLLDPIRAIGTLLFGLFLVPLHYHKRTDQRDPGSLCASGHRSCYAAYYWCMATGTIQSTALTLTGPLGRGILFIVLLVGLWISTLFMAALLVGCTRLGQPDVEEPKPFRSIEPAP